MIARPFLGVGRDRLDDVAVLRVVRQILDRSIGAVVDPHGNGALHAGDSEGLPRGGPAGDDDGRTVDGQADLGHAAERTEVSLNKPMVSFGQDQRRLPARKTMENPVGVAGFEPATSRV